MGIPEITKDPKPQRKRYKQCPHCPIPLRGTYADIAWHMKNHHPQIAYEHEGLQIGGHLNSRKRRRLILLANVLEGLRA